MTAAHPLDSWTDADQAELDVLIHEFVGGVIDHRARCSICRHGGPWCDPLRDALEIVLAWRRGRLLRSRAAALRSSEDILEWQAVDHAA